LNDNRDGEKSAYIQKIGQFNKKQEKSEATNQIDPQNGTSQFAKQHPYKPGSTGGSCET